MPHMLATLSLKKEAQAYPGNYRNFWENIPEHFPLASNDFIRNNGGDLSEKTYNHIVAQAQEKGIVFSDNPMVVMQSIMSTLDKIKQLENGHQEELIELAKDVVSEEWGVDRDSLDASFMEEPGGSGKEQQVEGEEAPMTPELQAEIGRRTLLNGLSQGAGLHSLTGIHHHPIARDKINEISPELLDLYTTFGNLITQTYFMLTPEQVEQMAPMLDDQGTGWSDAEEDGDVNAQGMTFSIICQELVKGIAAKSTEHQLDDNSREQNGLRPLTEEEKVTILNHSDKLEYEPLQIQFGTEMWRNFLSATNGMDKVDMISAISPSNNIDQDMSEVVNNPAAAKEIMQQMQERVEEEFYEDVPEADPIEAPEEELGEEPDDWDAIQRDLLGPDPKPHNPNIDQGLPPVEFDDDDDDDDDKPFWMV